MATLPTKKNIPVIGAATSARAELRAKLGVTSSSSMSMLGVSTDATTMRTKIQATPSNNGPPLTARNIVQSRAMRMEAMVKDAN